MKSLFQQHFPQFGPNKIRELSRLVFEIARRDGCGQADVLSRLPGQIKDFNRVKDFFERMRYPEAFAHHVEINETYSSVDIDPSAACKIHPHRPVRPTRIVIEETARHSSVARQMMKAFPDAEIETIDSYKTYINRHDVGPKEFNQRLETFYLISEHYDYFKPCPCTPGVVSCGYHNVNLGFGCPFECSYCFLQNYTNAPGIVFPANINDFFEAFQKYVHQGMRVGSGETADSLAFDHLTGFSSLLVDFFRNNPQSLFEFKTKSDNISGLLSVQSASNIVVGWSLNPQTVINSEEFYTASLLRRLESARDCAKAGYRIALHFDPIFYFPDWQNEYALLVEAVFRYVPKDSIAWISLGTLRMTARHKKMIENRFPGNKILDAELATAVDGKIRYFDFVRLRIYAHMLELLRQKVNKVPIYLCMEPVHIWQALNLKVNWP